MSASRVRWVSKKLARGGVALVSSAVFRVRPQGPPAGIRALTYHRFGAARRDPFCVSPSDFEAQMDWLVEHGRVASLDDVVRFARGERVVRDGAALVTIDDGSISAFEHALPVLARRKIPAVLFVSPGLVGRASVPEPLMDWNALRACAAGGLTVASHGWSHRSLEGLRTPEVVHELEASRRLLEIELGAAVEAFAYPYGTRRDFSARTEACVRAAGYAVAFHSQHGAIVPGSPLLSLPRVKIEGGEDLRMFERIVDGAMDPWRGVDRHLAWTQRPASATAG